jgi:hypothetical protein
MVSKQDLKSVNVVQNTYYKEGNSLTFNLMVRSKANIISKNKNLESNPENTNDDSNRKIIYNNFPSQEER